MCVPFFPSGWVNSVRHKKVLKLNTLETHFTFYYCFQRIIHSILIALMTMIGRRVRYMS